MLYNYSVGGTIKQINENVNYLISGIVVIDETLRLWDGSSKTPAPEAAGGLGNAIYSYFIPDYYLIIIRSPFQFDPTVSPPPQLYHFSGSAGVLYMQRIDGNMGSLMWFLEEGTGTWSEWHGGEFSFYNENFDPYDLYNELDTLAPIIRLKGRDWVEADPVFNTRIQTNILLTRIAPVNDADQSLSSPQGVQIL